jgi:hypothetical protein
LAINKSVHRVIPAVGLRLAGIFGDFFHLLFQIGKEKLLCPLQSRVSSGKSPPSLTSAGLRR